MILTATGVKLALACTLLLGGAAAAPVKVTVTAPSHTPKINTH